MNDADINKPAPSPADEAKNEPAKADSSTSQPDAKTEVKPKRSQVEKLIFTRNRIDEQLKELGIEAGDEDDDNKPVTVGMLKKQKLDEATKTAIELAEDIEDETEREAVKTHLQQTIKPSGNPEKDLQNAIILTSPDKAKQIIEIVKKGATVTKKTFVSGAGAPAKVEEQFVPTAEESHFMRPPYNLTKEQILEARKQNESKQQ